MRRFMTNTLFCPERNESLLYLYPNILPFCANDQSVLFFFTSSLLSSSWHVWVLSVPAKTKLGFYTLMRSLQYFFLCVNYALFYCINIPTLCKIALLYLFPLYFIWLCLFSERASFASPIFSSSPFSLIITCGYC